MGRLVKAFSLDREASRMVQFDEQKFLQEAGEIAERLRQEITGTATRPSAVEPPIGSALHGGDRPQLRVVTDHGLELTALDQAETANERTEVSDLMQRLRQREQHVATAPQKTTPIATPAPRDVKEAVDERLQWIERQTEKTKQLDAQEASLKQRERALADQAAEIEVRVERMATQLEAQLRERSESDQLRTSERLAELEGLLRQKSDEVERQKLLNRELQMTVADMQSAKSQAGQEQIERSRRMIEDCDRRITELAAEKSAAMREIEEARSSVETARRELGRERLEQRAELKTLRETQMRELEETRAKLDAAKLDFERTSTAWADRYQREHAELEGFLHSANSELAKLRGQYADEQRAGETRRIELQHQLGQLETAHKEAVANAKAEIAALVERERDKLEAKRHELKRMEAEFGEASARQQRELETELATRRTEFERRLQEQASEASQQRSAQLREIEQQREQLEKARANFVKDKCDWERQRGDEAGVLQDERQQLDSERARLETLNSRLTAERNGLQEELQAKQQAFESQMANLREARLAELRRLEQEFASREQLHVARMTQQENEFVARQRQAEHDFRLQVELSQKRLAEEHEQVDQHAARREHELQVVRAEIEQHAARREQDLHGIRADIERQRLQLEQERVAARRSLQAMDSQLRWFAQHLDAPAPGAAPVSAAPVSAAPIAAMQPQVASDLYSGTIRRIDTGVPAPTVAPHQVPAQPLAAVEPARVPTDTNVTAAQPERRKALEQYRARLGELQQQLSALSDRSPS